MLLSTLMASITPNPDYTGWVTNDDMVFAIDMDPTAATATAEEAYAVVQMGIEGLDANLNPVTQEKQYIRAGKSTLKTGAQRSFKITGDRYIGDDAQDYILKNASIYGVGNTVVTNYVYYNVLTGKGEKGQVSIIVNSDGGGNSGEAAAIDVEFKKVGSTPADYTWVPATIPAISYTIVPVDGATGVSKTAAIVITFANAIARHAVSIINSTSGDVVAVTESFDTARKVLTLTPSSALAGTTKYIVAVAGVVDVYGQALAASGKDFTTIA